MYKTGNKIITNLSGEILKAPNIIDISSDYGVTKDGSNLVSKVRNRYNANVFRPDSGNEPIENGDGFEFSSDRLIGNGFNSVDDWTCEFWIYFNVSLATTRQRFVTFENTTWLNNYIGILNANNTKFIDIQWYENGVSLAKTSVQGSNTELTENVWNHLYVQFTNGQIAFYTNGIAAKAWRNITQTKEYKPYVSLGKPYSLANINPLDGNIRKFRLAGFAKEKLTAWTGTAQRYPTDSQVFTPPTFPNTIL